MGSFAAVLMISCNKPSDTKAGIMISTTNAGTPLDTATFGAGCFWCVEAVFQRLDGVESVVSGYAGGHTTDPTYEEVCSGTTGHAEVIQVQYDPSRIGYADLLEVFFRTHDPTTPNRQGNDIGTQYRSAIFYHSDEQKAVAEEAKRQFDAAGLWPQPIVTEIAPIKNFFRAENYHQNYFNDNPNQPYCTYVIGPKVLKFTKEFKVRLKKQ